MLGGRVSCLRACAGTELQYSLLNDALNSGDSAVAGEAAGLSIGLLLLGRLGEPIADQAVRYHSHLCWSFGAKFALICGCRSRTALRLLTRRSTRK